MMLGRTGAMVADRYRLDQLTASAEAFEHWRAHDERLGRPVVVRLDQVADASGDPETGDDAESGERDEDWSPQPGLARIAQLNYPAVAAVYDAGMMADPVTGRVRYAVSEAVQGRSLAQMMAAGPQPWTRAADWGRQICGALAALHGIGIAHGSLGPDNVAVRDDRMVKVFDAGLAPDQEAGDESEPEPDGPDEAGSADPAREPESPNTDTHLLGAAGQEGGAADRTTVLPAERTGSRISVEKSSVEKTIGMTAAMKLNLAEYEAKIVSKLPPGAPADMYALGALLWQVVAGEPPAGAEAKPAADRTDSDDADPDDPDSDDPDSGDTGAAEAKTILIPDPGATAGPDAKTTVLRPLDEDDEQEEAAAPDLALLLEAGVPAGFATLLQELLDPDPVRRPTAARAVPRFAALAAAARASDKTMVVPPIPIRGVAPTQVMGAQPGATQLIGTQPADMPVRTRGSGAGGPGSGAGAAAGQQSDASRRNMMIIGLVLLLAAVAAGIGLLIVNLVSSSSQSQNNTPPVTSSPTGPVSSVTLPSATATSASPSPTQTQSSATKEPVVPPPSESPSPSPSPSPSTSPTPSPSASTTASGSDAPSCILFPSLCPSPSS